MTPPAELLGPGPGAMRWVQAAEDGFRTTANVDGARILLIDDTVTTGARMQSAAHVLQAEGAEVTVGLTVARKIRVNEQYKTIGLWEPQSRKPFSFSDPPWWASK